MRSFVLMVAGFLLLVSFIPWGNSLWGWSGLVYLLGWNVTWLLGMVGWLLNIMFMVFFGLISVLILNRLQRSERGRSPHGR